MKQTKATSLKKGTKDTLLAEPATTVLQVDLWTDTHPSDRSSARSGEINVLPSALAMVGDLLSVTGGEIRNSSSSSLSASFRDTVQAVNAARRLQRLVRGFSSASAEGPLYACFILTSAKETEDETDTDLHNSIAAVKQTQPAAVLFVGGICEAARSIPGLQFKDSDTNLLADGSDTHHRTMLQLLPPVHMEGYVDEPIVTTVRVERKKPPAAFVPPAGQPFVSSEVPPATKRKTASAVAAPAIKSISASGSEAGAPLDIDTSLPLKINPRWAIIGVSTVVLVASVLIFSPLLKGPSPPAPNQPHPAPPGGEKTSAPPPIPQGNENTATPPKPEITTKPPTPVSAKQSEPAHARTSKEPNSDEPKPVRGGQHGVTFSPAEIDLLIARADKDTGDGNYDRAIQEYTTVLNQDPSNALAKKGLQKALRNKGHN
jgi:hypothetical protein